MTDPTRTDSPPIVTQSLTVRFLALADAAKVFVMSQEAGARTWLPDQVCESEAHALELLEYLIEKCHNPGNPSAGPYVLGVCLNSTGELIGHVGLSPLDREVEIGYGIEDKHQGKGLASQAVRATAEWALTHFGLPRILAIVATDNAASCRVLENAGFELAEEAPGRLHGRSGLIRKYEKTRSVERP